MDRESTILKYMPIVESVAETLLRDGIPRHYKNDLVSEGTIALIQVVDHPSSSTIPIDKRIVRRAKDAMLQFWRREARHEPVGIIEDGLDADALDPFPTLPHAPGNPELAIDLPRAINTLTPSQLEVADLLERGFTQEESASRLGISQQAISKHLASIKKKFRANGCKNDGPEGT